MLEISGLTKAYAADSQRRAGKAALPAARDISIQITDGEFFTLLGPSGCGKTTTLRCIAGLETPDSGFVKLDDRILFSSQDRIDVKANKRGIGMVFQSYAIWPHLSVYENAAFPLKVMPARLRPPSHEIRARVMSVLSVMQLADLAERSATALSGGQQQRLALARALVTSPKLLLLDEPLSNLDAKLRVRLRLELMRVHRELGVTVLYVTHDQGEALAMSDRIALLRDGVIEQIGTPRDIYQAPVSAYAADFIGESNLIAGRVTGVERVDHGRRRGSIETDLGEFKGVAFDSDLTVGMPALLTVRPHVVEVQLSPPRDHSLWQEGTVETTMYVGEGTDCLIRLSSRDIRARVAASEAMAPGTRVWVRFPNDAVYVVAGVDSLAVSGTPIASGTASR